MKDKGILSTAGLKWIALVTMTIDHIGAIILYKIPNIGIIYDISRYIGRTAFPIFAFLLAQGFIYTKDRIKYFERLLVFSLVSEPFFDLAFSGSWIFKGYQNVIITLLFGYLSIWAFTESEDKGKWYMIIVSILCIFVPDFIHTDYGSKGTLLIILMYMVLRNTKNKNIGSIFPVIAIFNENSFIGNNQLPYWLPSVIPLYLYNGNKGKYPKYLFYAYYPVHLVVLYVISVIFFSVN